MRLRRIAFQPVNQPGLGCSEREPVVPGLLERDEELFDAFDGLLMQVIPTLEFALERKLTAERPLHAPFTPQREVAVGSEPLAEVQRADILKHLLHDDVIHVLDLLGLGFLQVE
jgi:hypothetical protein